MKEKEWNSECGDRSRRGSSYSVTLCPVPCSRHIGREIRSSQTLACVVCG